MHGSGSEKGRTFCGCLHSCDVMKAFGLQQWDVQAHNLFPACVAINKVTTTVNSSVIFFISRKISSNALHLKLYEDFPEITHE